MKKFFALLLALTMIFALAACGGEQDNAPASAQQTEQTEQSDTQEPAQQPEPPDDPKEDSVFNLCGLTVDDIKTCVGTSLGDGIETPTQYIVPVFCADTSSETFANWLNELADNCRKAAKDGTLYQDEFSWKVIDSFDIEAGAMNFLQFVYKTDGHTVYVTAADSGSVEGAFSCNIQVY